MTKQPATPREPKLPDSELEVMRVLWRRGPSSSREVWSELKTAGSSWTYATVNTLLQRLEAKGMAEADKSRMTYVYTPSVTKQQVVKRRVRSLVDKLYDGKGGMLVMHLLRSHKLSTEEMTEIRSLISESAENREQD